MLLTARTQHYLVKLVERPACVAYFFWLILYTVVEEYSLCSSYMWACCLLVHATWRVLVVVWLHFLYTSECCWWHTWLYVVAVSMVVSCNAGLCLSVVTVCFVCLSADIASSCRCNRCVNTSCSVRQSILTLKHSDEKSTEYAQLNVCWFSRQTFY